MNALFFMRSNITRYAVTAALLAASLLLMTLTAKAQTGITDLVVAKKVNLQGIVSPAAITGNVNDYAPSGFANATTLKLSSTADVNITGLAGGTAGRVLWIVNVGPFNLSFMPESGLSLAPNRFAIVGPTVVPPGYAVSFIYDTGAARWIGLSQGKSTTVWGQITGTIGNQTDLNDAIAGLAQAGLTTGVASPNDTVLFSAPNTSTLRIAALQRGIYSTLLAPGLPVTAAIKSFPQTDYPLSSLGLVSDGTYARWIGYDSSGNVVTSTQRFTNDASAIGLGIIVVKRVGGVTTFIDDGGPRSFLTSPQMAQFSTLERAVVGGFKSSVTVQNQSTNMTLARSAGTITGISANWASLGNKNVLDLAAVATAPFIEINPSIASATSLPAAVTNLTATNYWNGSASVALTGPNNASVKRFLLGVKGGLFVQEGEFQYATLDAAVAGYATAPFTTLLAQDLFIEVGRLAVVKNATDLSNATQARFFVTGGGAAGSSGGGGSAVTSVTGTTNEISVSAPVGAVQVGLPASLTFTGKTVTGGTFNSGAFNGTVGATTPSTGAFTTATAGSGKIVLGSNAGSGIGATSAADIDIQNTGDSSIRLWRSNTEYIQFGAARGGITGTNNLFLVDVVGPNSVQLRPLNFRFSSNGGSSFTTVAAMDLTGLAVTGQVSATQDLVSNGSTVYPGAGLSLNGGAGTQNGIYTNATGSPAVIFDHRGTGNTGIFQWRNGTGGANVMMSLNTTGLSVTGRVTNTFANLDGNGILNSTDTSNANFLVFYRSDATAIGSISRVGTTNAVAYNTTSDGRLKTNVRVFAAADAGRIIDGLRPVIFDWKSADVPSAKDVVGFIAQDEAAVDPILIRSGAVTPGDGDPANITQAWQRSDAALVPILVAEVKALRLRVAAVEGAQSPALPGRPLLFLALIIAATGAVYWLRVRVPGSKAKPKPQEAAADEAKP